MATPLPAVGAMPTGTPDMGRTRRRRGGVIWPVLLILIGGILLLQNLGLLGWDLWGTLWRLWPVILILFGIEMLMGNSLGGVRRLILAIVLLGLGIFAIGAVRTMQITPGAAIVNRQFSQTTDGATSARVHINFGAGRLEVGPLDPPAEGQLAAMSFDAPGPVDPRATYRVRDGIGDLNYGLNSRQFHPFTIPWGPRGESMAMSVQLSATTPIALDLNGGALSSQIDLANLRVNDVRVSSGASEMWMRMPANAGLVTARITGGATSTTIVIPDGVAARIRYSGGLNAMHVDLSRFPKEGKLYQSAGFDTATNRVDLTIEGGASRIDIQ